jgi:hypothetical protein
MSVTIANFLLKLKGNIINYNKHEVNDEILNSTHNIDKLYAVREQTGAFTWALCIV